MTDGHLFTLSGAQAHALAGQLAPQVGHNRLAPGPGGGPVQWVQLPGGRWISEKDPGYPYLAVAFQALCLIRLAPLFYGALACLGLYVGGRRWLGRFGGAAAVGLYCSSGAAILFAWRDYMPTFTEASLIAAGTGALLWVVLAAGASTRRRTWTGLALLTFFHNYLSMVLFLKALKHLDAIQAALSNYLITFFGVPIAAIWLGEKLTLVGIIGGIMILVSTLLITVWEERQALSRRAAATGRL